MRMLLVANIQLPLLEKIEFPVKGSEKCGHILGKIYDPMSHNCSLSIHVKYKEKSKEKKAIIVYMIYGGVYP